MNPEKPNNSARQIITLIILMAIFLAACGKGTSASIVIGKEPLTDLPLSKIGSIVITKNINQTKDTLTLNRANKQWVVVNRDGYPADAERIEKFIREFKDMKVLRELTAGKDQLGRIGLFDPDATSINSATRISLQDIEGKVIHTLHLGKELSAPKAESQASQAGFPDRRFVMIDSDRSKITVVDQTFSNANPSPSDWLNKGFVKVEKPNSIEVMYAGKESTNSWKIVKSSDVAEWKLAGKAPEDKTLDTTSAPTSPFSSPSFNDLATGTEKSQLDKNATQIKISTFDGLNYLVKVGPTPSGSDRIIQINVTGTLPMERTPDKNEKPEDKASLEKQWTDKQKILKEKLERESSFNKHAYRVSSYTVESILKKKDELLKDKEEGAIKPPADPPIPFIKPPPTPKK